MVDFIVLDIYFGTFSRGGRDCCIETGSFPEPRGNNLALVFFMRVLKFDSNSGGHEFLR